jgi:hypothetical protein
MYGFFVLLRKTKDDFNVFSLPLSAFVFFEEEKPTVGQTLVLYAEKDGVPYLNGTYKITEVVQGSGQELVLDLPESVHRIREEVRGFGVRIEPISYWVEKDNKHKVLRPTVLFQ